MQLVWFAARSPLLVALAAISTFSPTPAQCAAAWTADFALPSQAHDVAAMTLWDRDGSGPALATLTIAGNGLAPQRVNWWDATTGTWIGVPGTENLAVRALAGLPNGDLLVGGEFQYLGGLFVGHLARWDGTAWHSTGGVEGTVGRVTCLTVDGNGAVLVGGAFHEAGGVPANGIARWNGSTWSALGSGLPLAPNDIAVLANGDVVVAGFLPLVGGLPVGNIARWDGVSWAPMGAGTNSSVERLCVLANGDLLAGGSFSQMDGMTVNGIARWNGLGWSPMASGVTNTVTAIAELASGDVVIGGAFRETVAGVPVEHVARWSGSAWSPVGAGFDAVVAELVVLPNGDLAAGGAFHTADGQPATAVARWHGGAWQPLPFAPLSFGPTGEVRALAAATGGDVIAAGPFVAVGGVAATGIGRWNGSSWTALSGGITLGSAYALAVHPNGDVVVGGGFVTVDGATTHNVARWDGAAWNSLDVGVGGRVYALCCRGNGDVVAAGAFTSAGVAAPVFPNRIAVWNGSVWSPLGSGLTGGDVNALAILPDGDLVAGGAFTHAGGAAIAHIAKWSWSTQTWSALSSGTDGRVLALHVARDGSLLVAGAFTMAGSVLANGVARWDGTSWSGVGPGVASGTVRAVTDLADGDVVIGGQFALHGTSGTHVFARWNGSNWSGETASAFGYGNALLARDDGDLLVGGKFTQLAGIPSFHLARRVTPCPATAIPFGAGCSSGSGTLTLTSTRPPWLGAVHSAHATGFGANSIGIAMMGFTPFAPGQLPFASLPVPGGGGGCDLLQSLDIQTGLVLPVGGQGRWTAWMPDEPALTGGVFHLQFGELEFGPDWIGTYSTNALTCTIGSL